MPARRRASGPFLAVNCAALPRELLEAELFGIERGVATGVEARPGLLERASGGTLFLDEIGDMAPETQAKVLRVLEGTSVYRVGGRAPVQVDVRFVAATNRDLEALVEEGGFRRDLFHRLAAFQVKLPPLRGAAGGDPALAARFFHRELEKQRPVEPRHHPRRARRPGRLSLAGQRARAAERDRQGRAASGAGRAPGPPAPVGPRPRPRAGPGHPAAAPDPGRGRAPGRARGLRRGPGRRRRGRRLRHGAAGGLPDDLVPEDQGAGAVRGGGGSLAIASRPAAEGT